jgi:ribosome recycling factor
MMEPILSAGRERMQKAVEHLKEEFGGIRTGRANPGLVEKLRVDYYGSEVPLQQLASLSVPEPRILLVAPFDKGAMGAIEKAIQSSDLGVTPNNDGNVIRIVFPQLTEERRKELVKVVKARTEDGRVSVRNVRRAVRSELEDLERAGECSRDDLERVEKQLDKMTNDVIAEIDVMLGHKEQELLEV